MANSMLMIDAHVHLYPNCNLIQAINNSLTNIAAATLDEKDRDTVNIWLLTERSDCHYFQVLLDRVQVGDYMIEKTSEKEALVLKRDGKALLYIIGGRQIITQDGLEVCALATSRFFADRQYNAKDTIRIVQEAGGLAALNWAPGKWFMKRGKIVKEIIKNSNNSLFVSDTTMRPTIWPTPRLMRLAVKRKILLLYGSDPLPFAGEELMFSAYGSRLVGEFYHDRPATSLRRLLLSPDTIISPYGHRSGPFQFVKRQYRIMQDKKSWS